MNPDLDTVVCALYVRIDGLLAANPHCADDAEPRIAASRRAVADLSGLGEYDYFLASLAQ